ncbi:unnamed protein product, partial [Scytosiphon promiscuus]
SRSGSPTGDAEALRRKLHALSKSNRRLTRRISKRDVEISNLKARAKNYRERLSAYEAVPDDGIDRRARARNWSRSSSARRRSGGPERMNKSGSNNNIDNDDDDESDYLDRSDSCYSRSLSPNNHSNSNSRHHSYDFSETASTLVSTPGSLRSSRASVTPGSSRAFASSTAAAAAATSTPA